MKPKAPKYSVQEVTVTTFNHTSDNRITSDLKFLIQAENRNKHFKFSFGEGNLIVSYEGFDIAQGPFPAFDQPHRSTIELPVVRAQGHSIILHGAAASDLKKELSTKSDVLLKLKVKTHIRVKVGSLKSWKQKVKLSCQVSISTPSKPGKVKVTSSTCKLKN
ncbi:hypothetical protein KP509_39G045900 [Ceratopteris richardii]|nr:hypothetical protein KP509_39G045900 [Ceratopteris richardii]